MKTSEQPGKIKYHLRKGTILGFIAGVFVCFIIFAGGWAGTDGDFFNGTVSELNTVNDADFKNTVGKADCPVLVVVTGAGSTAERENLDIAKAFAVTYGDYCTVVTADRNAAAGSLQQYDADFAPQLALFEDGALCAERTNAASVGDLQAWVYKNCMQWKDHSEAQTASQYPTVYTMFGGEAYQFDSSDFFEWDIYGEYRIFPFDADGDGDTSPHFVACKGQEETGSSFNGLSPFFSGSMKNNQYYVNLPDLTAVAPAQNVTYYICVGRNSIYPTEASTKVTSVNGVHYYPHECSCLECLYLGEIRLMSNVDEKRYAGDLAPCDGRELNISDYEALYSLVGTTFGGDGKTTFCVPDLRGKAPFDGVKFYIILEGIYFTK